jgi:hypothetical protein
MQLLRAVLTRATPKKRLLVAAAWVLAGGACDQQGAPNEHLRPEALIVLDGAYEIENRDENEGTVLYKVNEPYPAGPAVETIRRRLESRGWRPLSEDFLNPGVPTSLVRGWGNYEDRTGAVPVEVHQWTAQWEDDSKRIVWYVLTYDGIRGPGDELRADGPLKIRATLLSQATVKALREAAKTGPNQKRP